jgi:thiosulfate dehydrogenase
MDGKGIDRYIVKIGNAFVLLVAVLMIAVVGVAGVLVVGPQHLIGYETPAPKSEAPASPEVWGPPAFSSMSPGDAGEKIKYGRELIARTAEYLGPSGSIMSVSNGMNCQNCHLDAGTRPFGNNYSAVAATYPKFRARSGTEETIEKRVNDCFERSLNGRALPNASREMQAIVAYINWLGTGVPKGKSPEGAGLVELPFLNTAADPVKGKLLYQEKCAVCHGSNGEGIKNPGSASWTFPPLWGKDSYNDGAGLYRLSRFAGYIKANMPLGATYTEPLLTDEEAWHIAAFVNSMPRPKMDITQDWPDISKKPVDHPFGPFADGFDEKQHKFGPFKPIIEKRKEKK